MPIDVQKGLDISFLVTVLPPTDSEGPSVRAAVLPAQGHLRGRLPGGEGDAAQVLHRRHLRQGNFSKRNNHSVHADERYITHNICGVSQKHSVLDRRT